MRGAHGHEQSVPIHEQIPGGPRQHEVVALHAPPVGTQVPLSPASFAPASWGGGEEEHAITIIAMTNKSRAEGAVVAIFMGSQGTAGKGGHA